MGRELPVVDGGKLVKSSLRSDGSRVRAYPADVSGRFARARRVVFALLIALWAALPWIKIGGHPAVFLDVEARRFYLFGQTFNSQDIWLVFFLLTGTAFGLVYVTAVAGRVWCGWACPQTVFLEGIFRPIERLIGGPREVRMRRDAGPMTLDRALRATAIHGLYLVAALFVAHVFLGYFVSLPRLFVMVRSAPAQHPEAFLWMAGTTAFFYGNFAWFREQLCLIVCPYGRLQSVLLDDDSLVVGYDERRGEPRGKKGTEGAGDCVDCNRCVVVCPTSIDIRNGLQVDCIACTACIDACDDIMHKLGRPPGLVRYDSLNGLRGLPKRLVRPRLYAYTALLLLGAVVATIALRHRTSFEANVLRLPGAPYTLEDGAIRNAFRIHVVNKTAHAETYRIEAEGAEGATFVIPLATMRLESMEDRYAPVFVTMPAAAYRGDGPITFRVVSESEPGAPKTVTATFLGAKK